MERDIEEIIKQIDALYCKNEDCYEIKQKAIQIVKNISKETADGKEKI